LGDMLGDAACLEGAAVAAELARTHHALSSPHNTALP
jgi:hypothetical protein